VHAPAEAAWEAATARPRRTARRARCGRARRCQRRADAHGRVVADCPDGHRLASVFFLRRANWRRRPRHGCGGVQDLLNKYYVDEVYDATSSIPSSARPTGALERRLMPDDRRHRQRRRGLRPRSAACALSRPVRFVSMLRRSSSACFSSSATTWCARCRLCSRLSSSCAHRCVALLFISNATVSATGSSARCPGRVGRHLGATLALWRGFDRWPEFQSSSAAWIPI